MHSPSTKTLILMVGGYGIPPHFKGNGNEKYALKRSLSLQVT